MREKSKWEARVGNVKGKLVSIKTETDLVEIASRKGQNKKPVWEHRQ